MWQETARSPRRPIVRTLTGIESDFAEQERHRYYLEILGDAAGERPFLYEPLFWARTRFPDASEEARRTLARSTLIRLLDEGFIDVFELDSPVPLDRPNARDLLISGPWETYSGPEWEFAATEAGVAAADAVPQETWDSLYRQP